MSLLVQWMNSDLTLGKRRPAIVVQADFLNMKIANTVLIQVTKSIRNTATEIVIDPARKPRSGLQFVSVASCNNFLTVRQAEIDKIIGSVSGAMLQQIELCLKAALELP